MSKVEIYHIMPKEQVREMVFSSDRLHEGLHIMDIFQRYWLQDCNQFHRIKINGRWKEWAEVRKLFDREIAGVSFKTRND